ncbi:hypothetical protein B0H63DRAFT_251885 [Podospora didyma]|uniref:CCZ1/INTU/HSP4 first Longin domain-containing protein n=1 Tax=Podospora didyma TaxID=330526 RepID=A0AAE0KLC9_9PEZI|nr:hypothetical protein B0H63DRAFT_251885 [Podospora didyma]
MAAAIPLSPSSPSIVPAQLGFLAIYNPSLGATDKTIDDQIVYYASVNTQSGPKRRRHRGNASRRNAGRPTEALSKEERNERLRHIGLAQAMVEFGKSFSGGISVDTIDTERSRVVLHELEPGWWILASIDLTHLPKSKTLSTSPPPAPDKGKFAAESPSLDLDEQFEFSSREVKPASLLLQDLLRAHSVFLLHHASSLSALFVRTQRVKFTSILGRYWDLFLSTWNVLLHGNPACSAFGGIKIAACGELGIGVGEEERGSGEREVLEGLVGRMEGLVDLIVGKFGDDDVHPDELRESYDEAGQWLGTGNEVGAEDGSVFLGVGAISRHSLRALTWWMEDCYTWGENAYGVLESPTAIRPPPRKKRSANKKTATSEASAPIASRNLTKAQPQSGDAQSTVFSKLNKRSSVGSSEPELSPGLSVADPGHSGAGMDRIFNYLKLGYGTSWTLSNSTPAEHGDVSHDATAKLSEVTDTAGVVKHAPDASAGRFLVGLMGNIEESENTGDVEDSTSPDQVEGSDTSPRILLRTVTVELEAEGENRPESEIVKDLGSQEDMESKNNEEGHEKKNSVASFDIQDLNKTKKLRIVVYASRPFIFVFLFQLHTESLPFEAFYRSLHHQLTPLRKPLTNSTAYRPGRPDVGSAISAQICDLVWDPRFLTIHSTIPNIPDPVTPAAAQPPAPWNRIEALNIHNQILNMFITTREDLSGFERTCKTSRGWWIVWNRIFEQVQQRRESGDVSDDLNESEISSGYGDDEEATKWPKPELVITKEIFLIRKASDHAGGVRGVSASYVTPGATGGWADGASRLAQGIGIDTRRYIEGLLSLNR